jgi:transcriptional regulator with XRE-family HTH domain
MPKNFLKEIRETKNISQVELAKKIGVSKAHISKFEKGTFAVSFKVLNKIAEALDVSPEKIMTGEFKDNFDENYRLLLQDCVEMATDEFINDFDKKDILKIATMMFNIMLNYQNNQKNSEILENFIKKTQDKMFEGLAAKCSLKYIKKNDEKSPTSSS